MSKIVSEGDNNEDVGDNNVTAQQLAPQQQAQQQEPAADPNNDPAADPNNQIAADPNNQIAADPNQIQSTTAANQPFEGESAAGENEDSDAIRRSQRLAQQGAKPKYVYPKPRKNAAKHKKRAAAQTKASATRETSAQAPPPSSKQAPPRSLLDISSAEFQKTVEKSLESVRKQQSDAESADYTSCDSDSSDGEEVTDLATAREAIINQANQIVLELERSATVEKGKAIVAHRLARLDAWRTIRSSDEERREQMQEERRKKKKEQKRKEQAEATARRANEQADFRREKIEKAANTALSLRPTLSPKLMRSRPTISTAANYDLEMLGAYEHENRDEDYRLTPPKLRTPTNQHPPQEQPFADQQQTNQLYLQRNLAKAQNSQPNQTEVEQLDAQIRQKRKELQALATQCDLVQEKRDAVREEADRAQYRLENINSLINQQHQVNRESLYNPLPPNARPTMAPSQNAPPTMAPHPQTTLTMAPHHQTTPTMAPHPQTTPTMAPHHQTTPTMAPLHQTTPTMAPQQYAQPNMAPRQQESSSTAYFSPPTMAPQKEAPAPKTAPRAATMQFPQPTMFQPPQQYTTPFDSQVSRNISRLELPPYIGKNDKRSALEYLELVHDKSQAHGVPLLETVHYKMPGCLVRDAKYWFKINKDSFTSWEIFHAEFLKEFSHTNYFKKLRRELELRTQAPDECFPTFIQKIWGYYQILGEEANEDAIVERVLDNMNRKSRAYVRDKQFSSVQELLLYAREVQANIDRDSEYIPPPKPEDSVEKSLAHYKPYKSNNAHSSDRGRPRERPQNAHASRENSESRNYAIASSRENSNDRSNANSRENSRDRNNVNRSNDSAPDHNNRGRTTFARGTSRSPSRRQPYRPPTPAPRSKNE